MILEDQVYKLKTINLDNLNELEVEEKQSSKEFDKFYKLITVTEYDTRFVDHK